MTPVIPTPPVLGQLELVETYEFYDRPILFSGRRATGEYYLVVLADESVASDTWWFVAMSEGRFKFVRSGGIDLKDAFRTSEDGSVLQVVVPKVGGGAPAIASLPVANLRDDLLPDAGEKLELRTETLPAPRENALRVLAQQVRREAVELRLQFPFMMRTEAPSRLLGQVLEALQETVDAIGQAVIGQATRRGSIDPGIRSQTELSVINAFPGSFGLQMVVSYGVDLFGASLGGDALDKLTELFSIGNNPEQLKAVLRQLKARSAAKYRTLLERLAVAQTGMEFSWESIKPGRGRRVTLPFNVAQAAVEVVDQVTTEMAERKEVTGRLVMLNTDANTFRIHDEQNHKRYTGKIGPDLDIREMRPQIEEVYVATLLEIVEVASVTGDEKSKWQLAELRPARRR